MTRKTAKKGPKRAGPIGQNIRRLRERHRLTQKALAEQAGVARITVAMLESGAHQTASQETISKIASALGVRADELLASHGVVETPMEPLIRDFLASPWAATLKPPISDEEIAWLRGVPSVFWIDCPPTAEALHYFVLGYRQRKQREGK